MLDVIKTIIGDLNMLFVTELNLIQIPKMHMILNNFIFILIKIMNLYGILEKYGFAFTHKLKLLFISKLNNKFIHSSKKMYRMKK